MLQVFGKKPENSIYLGDQPYAIRNDCSLGQWKVGDGDIKGKEIEISIIKVSRYFGTLGKAANTLWLQVWFVPVEAFMQTSPALVDLANTQNLIALDGLSSTDVQILLESRNQQYLQAS